MNEPEIDPTDRVRVLQRLQLHRGLLKISALLAVMSLLGLALVRVVGVHPGSGLEELTLAATAWLAVTGLPLHMNLWGGPWHLALPAAVLSVLGYARLTLGAIGTPMIVALIAGVALGCITAVMVRNRFRQLWIAADESDMES